MKKLLLVLSLLTVGAPLYAIRGLIEETKREAEDAAAQEKRNAEFLEAVKNNNAARVQELLAQGVNINAKDKKGNSALKLASENGNLEIVKLLLPHDLEGMRKNTESYVSLLPKELTEEVRKYGYNIDVNAKNNSGATALMEASYKGHLEVIKRLLDVPDIDVNAKDDDAGFTALIWAAQQGHLNVVNLLLEKGADANRKNKWGLTALMWASTEGRTDIVKRLLMVPGIDVNAKDNSGQTALAWAVQQGRTNIVKLLLENGADINKPDNNGMTALAWAANNGRNEIVKLLLAQKSLSAEDARKVANTAGIAADIKKMIEDALAERSK